MGERTEKLIERFNLEFERVGGVFIMAKKDQILPILNQTLKVENAEKIFVEKFDDELSDILKQLDAKQIITQAHSEKQLVEVDASITGCDYLIAETGTIVFIHNEKRFKSSILLPRVHIVIAKSEQIYESFEHVFEKMDKKFDSIFLVTGPSRTADIEKVIVKGVHGPQMVYLILI
jgi:L-lactate dehydrogenase complex protein LldG